MKTYIVTATVVDEVCVADRHSAGNEYMTLDYIPGTAWWGAVSSLTGIRPGETPTDEFQTLFYSDEVIFTNLYPERQFRRSHPIPLSARTRKSAPRFKPLKSGEEALFRDRRSAEEGEQVLYPGGVKDWLMGIPSEFDPDWEVMRGWYAGDPPKCESISVRMAMRGHNERPDRSGTTREGRLFARQNLARGKKFRGALRAVTPAGESALSWLISNFLDSPSFEVFIGRQPGCIHVELDDYGTSPPDWQPPVGEVKEDEDFLTVTLLSDAILLDRWLRPLRHLPSDDLKAALGPDVNVEGPCAHFSALRQVFGWNGAYSRPRETELAVEAGSAFLYLVSWSEKVTPEERARRLNELQQRGIGLRRAEGFGEIRINDPFHSAAWEVD